jgi:PAS domain S-box-containing protein
MGLAEDIIATVREPFLVLSADLRVVSANTSFCEIFRLSLPATEGRLFYELDNGHWNIPRLRHLLEEFVSHSNISIRDFSVEHFFPNLGRKYLLLNARHFPAGENERLVLLAIEDVTARRIAEMSCAEAEGRYKSLVENIRDHSIFMMDIQGRVTSWNAEAERVTGYPAHEVFGRYFSFLFTAEEQQAGFDRIELTEAREIGRAVDECWHVRKDGVLFWAVGIVTPMYDLAGKLTGYSKILRDMTKRKRAEQLLQTEGSNLRETERRKNEFLAMLAHELRNPLGPIQNSVALLSLMQPTNDQLKCIEVIDRQMVQLTRLVEDLLEVSRITTGRIRILPKRLDLRSIIQNAIDAVRSSAEARNLTLKTTLSDQPIWLMADAVRMEQIISNLLGNAIKYTEPGGFIFLYVAADRNTAVVRMSIKDTGIGIDPKDLPHVFELFNQSDKSLERSKGGLGIGLSLVQRLVELHGGSVTAYSEGLGKGSEFVVRLPILDGMPDEDVIMGS